MKIARTWDPLLTLLIFAAGFAGCAHSTVDPAEPSPPHGILWRALDPAGVWVEIEASTGITALQIRVANQAGFSQLERLGDRIAEPALIARWTQALRTLPKCTAQSTGTAPNWLSGFKVSGFGRTLFVLPHPGDTSRATYAETEAQARAGSPCAFSRQLFEQLRTASPKLWFFARPSIRESEDIRTFTVTVPGQTPVSFARTAQGWNRGKKKIPSPTVRNLLDSSLFAQLEPKAPDTSGPSESLPLRITLQGRGFAPVELQFSLPIRTLKSSERPTLEGVLTDASRQALVSGLRQALPGSASAVVH